MKKSKISVILGISVFLLSMCGCGDKKQEDVVETVIFSEAAEESEPVILREEKPQTEESQIQTEQESETQTEESIGFADRAEVAYEITEQHYVEGDIVQITYPAVCNMENSSLQEQINQNILESLKTIMPMEGCTSYEMSYEIATKGSGVFSFVCRGYANYEQAAYPTNIVRTFNIDMTNGENLRLKDYADMETIVSALETNKGYQVLNEGVGQEDFDMFLNNGYVTDYAMTLLDYDVDFHNLSFIPAGYSCIRDNHVVLFMEAEHAMGDYVELVLEGQL